MGAGEGAGGIGVCQQHTGINNTSQPSAAANDPSLPAPTCRRQYEAQEQGRGLEGPRLELGVELQMEAGGVGGGAASELRAALVTFKMPPQCLFHSCCIHSSPTPCWPLLAPSSACPAHLRGHEEAVPRQLHNLHARPGVVLAHKPQARRLKLVHQLRVDLIPSGEEGRGVGECG